MLKRYNTAVIATNVQNLMAYSEQIRLGIDDERIKLEKNPEIGENAVFHQ